jgi:hypothetical protein
LADFTTTTPELKFSVHTGVSLADFRKTSRALSSGKGVAR